jgi:retron-type reverse transcriptase
MAPVFLDIEKAFDTTWHSGLLYKLSNLEFSKSLIKLIGSFLSQRKFSVSVEGEMSTRREMQAGVPQGSVLSPTLFNLYINDDPQTHGVHLAFLQTTPVCMRHIARRVYCQKSAAWSQLNGDLV